MSDETTTPLSDVQFRPLFDQTNNLVRNNPQIFQEHGKSLDDEYSNLALRHRDAVWKFGYWKMGRLARARSNKFCTRALDRKHNWQLLQRSGSIQEPKRIRNKVGRLCPIPQRRMERFSKAFQEVLDGLERDPLDCRTEPDRRAMAYRVVLLTWLLSDPDADAFRPLLTEFQDWEWDGNFKAFMEGPIGETAVLGPNGSVMLRSDFVDRRNDARKNILDCYWLRWLPLLRRAIELVSHEIVVTLENNRNTTHTVQTDNTVGILPPSPLNDLGARFDKIAKQDRSLYARANNIEHKTVYQLSSNNGNSGAERSFRRLSQEAMTLLGLPNTGLQGSIDSWLSHLFDAGVVLAEVETIMNTSNGRLTCRTIRNVAEASAALCRKIQAQPPTERLADAIFDVCSKARGWQADLTMLHATEKGQINIGRPVNHDDKVEAYDRAERSSDKLCQAIDRAVAAIRGVDPYVRAIKNTKPGHWTTELKTQLTAFRSDVYGRGAAIVDEQSGKQFQAILNNLHERQRFLRNIDTSALDAPLIQQPMTAAPTSEGQPKPSQLPDLDEVHRWYRDNAKRLKSAHAKWFTALPDAWMREYETYAAWEKLPEPERMKQSAPPMPCPGCYWCGAVSESVWPLVIAIYRIMDALDEGKIVGSDKSPLYERTLMVQALITRKESDPTLVGLPSSGFDAPADAYRPLPTNFIEIANFTGLQSPHHDSRELVGHYFNPRDYIAKPPTDVPIEQRSMEWATANKCAQDAARWQRCVHRAWAWAQSQLGEQGVGTIGKHTKIESSRLSRNEANIKAREYLKQNPNATARDVANNVGCALGQVSKLPT